MSTVKQKAVPPQLLSLVLLAQLFERLETSRAQVDAGQYRLVAQRLAGELATVKPDDDFRLVLNQFPATAEVYENITYEHAGLSRSPLEMSLNSEMSAAEAIAAAAR